MNISHRDVGRNFVRLLGMTAVMVATSAHAGPFTSIRIGDQDGFGFNPTTGLVRANASHTTPADTNLNGLLQQTEFLPDLNKDGSVATGAGDDFDNRSVAEKANTGPLGGSGFTDSGSLGFKWTDISLSTSFTGPNFPDPAGAALPNSPAFLFKFHVNAADVAVGSQLSFNLIFGDYDTAPANVTLSFASATQRTATLATQSGADDGLIQAVSALLNFTEVFTSDGLGGYDGFLNVNFNAPNEPYMAFDFVELSTTGIARGLPEPGSLALLALGLAGLTVARRRKQ